MRDEALDNVLGSAAPTSQVQTVIEPFNGGGSLTARCRCLVPCATTTTGGAPAALGRGLLYEHGLLGSEGEAGSSHGRDFASEHNFIACDTRWSGLAEENLAPSN
ncbi:MAG: hypothetical protein P8R42_29065 [Candidatus Binatia bacterium]|nr:hypothetical protein [Candidatus Binatia bacterium]